MIICNDTIIYHIWKAWSAWWSVMLTRTLNCAVTEKVSLTASIVGKYLIGDWKKLSYFIFNPRKMILPLPWAKMNPKERHLFRCIWTYNMKRGVLVNIQTDHPTRKWWLMQHQRQRKKWRAIIMMHLYLAGGTLRNKNKKSFNYPFEFTLTWIDFCESTQ